MQAVRLKLASGKPKVVPPDEAQSLSDREVPHQGADRHGCAQKVGGVQCLKLLIFCLKVISHISFGYYTLAIASKM